MPNVTVDLPGVGASTTIEVRDGEAVLVGRAPDIAALRASVPQPVRPHEVSSPSASGNHVVVWSSDDTMTVLDVGSRNGTWLELPRERAVRVPSGPLRLSLAEPSTERRRFAPLGSASWRGVKDFGDSLERSIRTWLLQHGLAAQVVHRSVRRPEPSVADHPGRLPLASGGELGVVAEQTMDPQWHDALREVWRFVQAENDRLETEETARADGLILASPSIRRSHQRVVEAARRGARVMLVGASGVGKEGLARVYHRHAGRAGPFIARNCGMLTPELARSELFGSEPGAFTGATRRVVGAVERAQGGTLFLDELFEMPAEVQPMLLRFLDRGEFERLGDYGGTRHSDAAIVSATNREPAAALERGEFRVDLWYRLSNELVEVAPLEERPEDVRALLEARVTRPGVPALETLEPEALEVVLGHRWPGNFRELESFVVRLDGSRVNAAQCRELLARGTPGGLVEPAARAPAPSEVAWGAALERAVAAFAEDCGHGPASWDDVKELVEKYLKPLLFARLTGAQAGSDVKALAQRSGADRGTVGKQLQRFVERFGR